MNNKPESYNELPQTAQHKNYLKKNLVSLPFPSKRTIFSKGTNKENPREEPTKTNRP